MTKAHRKHKHHHDHGHHHHDHSHMKVLFILKLRQDYYGGCDDEGEYSNVLSSGLFNSARFVVEMLNKQGIHTTMVQVKDNNDISAAVKKHKATHVVIEAFWVLPSKFKKLQELYRDVKWIVRVHSEVPFLAQEGIAVDWIFDYVKNDNVVVGFNALGIFHTFRRLIHEANPDWKDTKVRDKILYLPNFYPVSDDNKAHSMDCGHTINIACFGALRTMKDQLLQAMAAMQFAFDIGKKLRFHVSHAFHGGDGGQSILKNLRALFENTGQELVEHEWSTHKDFTKILSKMDLGMQVSFTESFNIIAADMVNLRLPVVVSPEISWCSKLVQADPTNLDDIVSKLERAWGKKRYHIEKANLAGLIRFSVSSREAWMDYLHNENQNGALAPFTKDTRGE